MASLIRGNPFEPHRVDAIESWGQAAQSRERTATYSILNNIYNYLLRSAVSPTGHATLPPITHVWADFTYTILPANSQTSSLHSPFSILHRICPAENKRVRSPASSASARARLETRYLLPTPKPASQPPHISPRRSPSPVPSSSSYSSFLPLAIMDRNPASSTGVSRPPQHSRPPPPGHALTASAIPRSHSDGM